MACDRSEERPRRARPSVGWPTTDPPQKISPGRHVELRGPTKDCPECTNKIPKAARRCPDCAAQLMPPSDEVAEAMRQVGAPSGAQIADHAAKVLAGRLTGEDGVSSE